MAKTHFAINIKGHKLLTKDKEPYNSSLLTVFVKNIYFAQKYVWILWIKKKKNSIWSKKKKKKKIG